MLVIIVGFYATIEIHTTTLFSFQWETTIEDVHLECTTFDTWLLIPLHIMRPRVVICNMRWIMLILLLLFDNFSNFFEIFESKSLFLNSFKALELFEILILPLAFWGGIFSIGWTNHGLNHDYLLLFSKSFEIYTTPTWPFGTISIRAPTWATNILC